MQKYSLCFLSLFIASILLMNLAFSCEKSYKLMHENGLYIVKVNLNSAKIKPYVAEKLETIDVIAKKTNASVVINTGFFDARNQKTVSYIIEGENIIANPAYNENLIYNQNLKPYLNKIFNRAELRLIECNGKITANINLHNESVPDNCKLLSSTQAGPKILPDMDLEQEFFIVKKDGKIVRDSVGLLRKTDRSMVAVKGHYLYLIINDENYPLDIYEMKEKLEKYKFEQAMGFDGGGSVSLFVRHSDGIFYQDREEKGASRAVKSALLVY